MGLTSSDLLEEIMYEAHRLGVINELREMVSKQLDTPTPTAQSMLPYYESAFSELKKRLD